MQNFTVIKKGDFYITVDEEKRPVFAVTLCDVIHKYSHTTVAEVVKRILAKDLEKDRPLLQLDTKMVGEVIDVIEKNKKDLSSD